MVARTAARFWYPIPLPDPGFGGIRVRKEASRDRTGAPESRLVLETPYRIRGRAVIVHVEAASLRIREKGCRAGTLEITWAQIYNRAAEITAQRARQQARERKMGR